jgi:hypothetical protein
MKRDCEAIVEEMKKVEETRFENVWSEANETITTQIASIKEESKKDTEKMANEVELDHENQIQSLEYETGWLKNQKETADDTIEALRNTLSKKEDQMREMEEEMNSERGCHSYHKLFLITKALQLQQEIKSKDAVHTKKIERINQQHSESEKRLCAKADMLEQRSSKFEGNMKLISSTLLNHKRDALLEHKAKSREVATRLNEVSEKIQTVDAKRQKEKSFVDNLVQAMHDVEKQLQDHSQTSALQGGKINISHARKKRRLDEEYVFILTDVF